MVVTGVGFFIWCLYWCVLILFAVIHKPIQHLFVHPKSGARSLLFLRCCAYAVYERARQQHDLSIACIGIFFFKCFVGQLIPGHTEHPPGIINSIGQLPGQCLRSKKPVIADWVMTLKIVACLFRLQKCYCFFKCASYCFCRPARALL